MELHHVVMNAMVNTLVRHCVTLEEGGFEGVDIEVDMNGVLVLKDINVLPGEVVRMNSPVSSATLGL